MRSIASLHLTYTWVMVGNDTNQEYIARVSQVRQPIYPWYIYAFRLTKQISWSILDQTALRAYKHRSCYRNKQDAVSILLIILYLKHKCHGWPPQGPQLEDHIAGSGCQQRWLAILTLPQPMQVFKVMQHILNATLIYDNTRVKFSVLS